MAEGLGDMVVGSGVIKIHADVDKADRDIHGLSGRGGAALGILGRAGAAAFAGIGLAAGGAVGFGVKIASDTQQARIGFETMLGSGEKAGAFLKDLQAFAAKTPFEFPQLRESASRLVAVGVETERVIPLMTALGDATAGMGTGAEGIQAAVRALTQMQQKGKVTGEEMLQLTEAGIPAWDALATKMGVSVPEAQAKVSAGQVQVNELMGAIEERAGPAMQRLSGMMDKQSQTLAGLFSTLKDTVGQSLGTMAEPLVASLTKSMPVITKTIDDVLQSVGPPLTQFASMFLNTFVGLLPVIAPVISQIANVFSAFMTALGPVFQAILPHISQFATIIGTAMSQAINAIAPVLPVIAEAFASMLPAIAPLVPLIGGVFATVVKALAPIIAALAPIIAEVAELMLGALLQAFNQMKPLFPVLAQVAVQLINALAPFLPQIVSIAGQLLTALMPAFVAILRALLPILPPIVQLITALLPPFLSLVNMLIPIINVLAGVLGGVASVLAGVLAGALRVIADLVQDVTGFFKNLWNASEPIRNSLAGGFQKIADAVKNVWDFVKKAAAAIADLISKIPAWMRPGSPPPFAIGLMHVAGGFQEITRTARRAAAVINAMNTPAFALGGMTARGSAGGSTSYVTTVIELDGREVARAVTPHVIDEQIKHGNRNGTIFG